MNGEELWNVVIAALSSLEEELRITTGLWFRASSHDERICIYRAIDNTSSSKLSIQRIIFI